MKIAPIHGDLMVDGTHLTGGPNESSPNVKECYAVGIASAS